MGRIRTHFIKSLAEQLIKLYPERFSEDWLANRQVLDELRIIDEKFTRNKVAGYIVRLKRAKRF
jgi:ribosomal protein S17E